MSSQTIHDAFEPVMARYRAEQLKDTWGHLAPARNKKYKGHVVFALGCFGSDDLNPTVLSCELGDLDSSPWFYECLMSFLEDFGGDAGNVYRFEGNFCNYKFDGTIRKLNLNAGAQ